MNIANFIKDYREKNTDLYNISSTKSINEKLNKIQILLKSISEDIKNVIDLPEVCDLMEQFNLASRREKR